MQLPRSFGSSNVGPVNHLGRALARSGDPAAAQTEFEKALAGAAFPEAEAARAELAHLRAQAPL